jgi:ribosomal protein S18 acetylase RimI-like enzyme
MAVKNDYQVRPANPGDHDQILHLISNGSFVHRHLDWRTPLEWIGFPPYLVIEHNGQIKSVLACPPDPPSIGWVRVFATISEFSADRAWNIMWANVLRLMEATSGSQVAAIVLNNWFQEILERSGFANQQDIVMLTWLGKYFSEVKLPARFQIRNMVETDILDVAELDAIAFDPLWQNSRSALQKAFKQAALATIVEEEGVIVGYQISTKNFFGGHLARLAVHPSLQGKRIGYSLVTDMIQKLNRIGVTNISVNTQSDNSISLSLYKSIGFRENGDRYPVYSYEVT